MIVPMVWTGIAAGLTYGLTAFAKVEGEKFDWVKFGTTAAVGALAGAVMTIFDWDIGTAYNYLITLGTVPVFENICKAIYRKFIDKKKRR